MPRNPAKRRYPLNVDVLQKAARAHGDERPIDISRRTGIDKHVISRLYNGRDLSLATLLTLSDTYGVPANLLVLREDQSAQEEAA